MNKTQADALSAFWRDWCKENFINPMSADEIPLFGHGLTEAQCNVVRAFSALWDAANDSVRGGQRSNLKKED